MIHRRGDTTPLKFPASDGCRLHGYTGGKLLQRYTRYRITNNVEYLWRRFSFIPRIEVPGKRIKLVKW